MNRCLGILLAICLLGTLNAQTPTMKPIPDGWSHFAWNTPKSQIEVELQEKGWAIEPDYGDPFYSTITRTQNEGWDIRLEYDDTAELCLVTMSQSFDIVSGEEAHQAAESAQVALREELGEAYQIVLGSHPDVSRWIWESETTRVLATFDLESKIIDEMGAGAFEIEVVYTRID